MLAKLFLALVNIKAHFLKEMSDGRHFIPYVKCRPPLGFCLERAELKPLGAMSSIQNILTKI